MGKWIVILVLVILFIGILIISATRYKALMRVYKKYSQVRNHNCITGMEFARRAIPLLQLDTQIRIINKKLGDFYSPKDDFVALSVDTARQASVASVCITAHELGHAVQNKRQSTLFELQGCLMALGKIANILFYPSIIIGLILLFFPTYNNAGQILLLAALAFWIIIYLLKLTTIPVELQASDIAYDFLKDNKVLTQEELKGAKRVLIAAANTYIASLFSGPLKFFRALNILFRR